MHILWDHVAAVAETGIKLGERHHLLTPGEWLLWARRVTGWEDLQVYRHRTHGSFVLMDLVYPDFGVGRELKVLPAPPDQGGWVGKAWLDRHAKPVELTLGELEHRWKSEAVARQQERVDTEYARKDTQTHLRRKGQEEIAAALEMQPYAIGQRTDEAASEINKAAKRAW